LSYAASFYIDTYPLFYSTKNTVIMRYQRETVICGAIPFVVKGKRALTGGESKLLFIGEV
jgi:hypothetical protein